MANREQTKTTFQFTEQEALCAAKSVLGTRDLPAKLSAVLLAGLCLVGALRAARKLPLLPPFAVLGGYAAGAGAWVLLLLVLRQRERRYAQRLLRREFLLSVSKEGFALFEKNASGVCGEQPRLQAAFSEIQLVQCGQLLCCLFSPAGSVCLPLWAVKNHLPLAALLADASRCSWL